MATERPRRRKKPTPKQASKELAMEQRRAKAVELRLASHSIREIAKKLKCGIATVHADLEAVLSRTKEETDDAVKVERELSLQRIDVATRGLWARLKRGDTKAVDAFVKLDARRAKMLGLDAPERKELSGPEGEPLVLDAREALLERLTRLVGGEVTDESAGSVPQEPDPGGSESSPV